MWYRYDEYYFDSRLEGYHKTDSEYYEELLRLTEGLEIERVVVDPSAASFIECIRRGGKFRVIPAKNNVLDGIRKVSEAFRDGRLYISPKCISALKEFSLYRWDNSTHKDSVRKENDHAMDDIRYFVSTCLDTETDTFFAIAAERA